MDNQELVSMLRDLESDLVERKASLSDPDRVRQAICAFANDLPDHRRPETRSLLPHLAGSFFGVYRAARMVKKLRQELIRGKILCWLLIVLRQI